MLPSFITTVSIPLLATQSTVSTKNCELIIQDGYDSIVKLAKVDNEISMSRIYMSIVAFYH